MDSWRQTILGSQVRIALAVHERNAMNAKILLVLLSLAFGASTLTGCNTVQGAGKDVEKAGAKIQSEAQEHKTY